MSRNKSYYQLNHVYQDLIDTFRELSLHSGYKESSIETRVASASSFFLDLQLDGANNISVISEEMVINHFLSYGNTPKSAGYRSSVVSVLKLNIQNSEKEKKSSLITLMSYIPVVRDVRKTIQYLTSEEVNKIHDALMDSTNKLRYRERAIGLLLLYTGMRASDISNLKISSIDWQHELISTVQSKTGHSLEIPLIPIVGNAIYDYLNYERPKSENECIFLSTSKPHNELSNKSITGCVNMIFDAADVRKNPGDRRGSHIFRHHVATKLLNNGVPKPVISQTLGHSSPVSLERYLNADFSHLRECALDISDFPVKGGELSE